MPREEKKKQSAIDATNATSQMTVPLNFIELRGAPLMLLCKIIVAYAIPVPLLIASPGQPALRRNEEMVAHSRNIPLLGKAIPQLSIQLSIVSNF